MKVLHYGLGPNYGGIEAYLKDLSTLLHDRGVHSEFIYASFREPAYYQHFKRLGCALHRITPRSKSYLQNQKELSQILTRDRFDVFHHHAASASFSAPVRTALKAEIPVLWHSHNSGPAPSVRSQVLHRLNRLSLPWKEIRKVAVSNSAGKWAFGNGESFEIVPNGIDLQYFSSAHKERTQTREMLEISDNALVIMQIGTLSRVKNHMFTLEVFKEILRFRPDSVLLIVGEGYLASNIRHSLRSNELTANVQLLGRRDDIASLLGATDAVVVPSHSEGFSLAALEAQAAGVACFASENVPGEVLVADNAYQLNLEKGPRVWAQHILTQRLTYETDPIVGLEDAGFSRHSNADRINSIYRTLST